PSRVSKRSWTCLVVQVLTTAPRRGRVRTKPSASSWGIASRSGTRDTCRSSASRCSGSREPSGYRPTVIRRRTSAYTLAESGTAPSRRPGGTGRSGSAPDVICAPGLGRFGSGPTADPTSPEPAGIDGTGGGASALELLAGVTGDHLFHEIGDLARRVPAGVHDRLEAEPALVARCHARQPGEFVLTRTADVEFLLVGGVGATAGAGPAEGAEGREQVDQAPRAPSWSTTADRIGRWSHRRRRGDRLHRRRRPVGIRSTGPVRRRGPGRGGNRVR